MKRKLAAGGTPAPGAAPLPPRRPPEGVADVSAAGAGAGAGAIGTGRTETAGDAPVERMGGASGTPLPPAAVEDAGAGAGAGAGGRSHETDFASAGWATDEDVEAELAEPAEAEPAAEPAEAACAWRARSLRARSCTRPKAGWISARVIACIVAMSSLPRRRRCSAN